MPAQIRTGQSLTEPPRTSLITTTDFTDLRHAIRTLTRHRGFGTVAVLVLAVSVAINTLIFCMLYGIILHPLPYRAPERLVRLFDAGTDQPKFPVSLAHFLDYRANARSLESIALYTGNDVELTANEGQSRRLIGVAITSDYFSVLGKSPALGRAFQEADLRRDVHNAILSHRLWKNRFQSDPAIVGKTIRLNRAPWTVIGVAPEGFQHVGGDYRSPLQGETVDIWLPLVLEGREQALHGWHYCNAVARLRDGVTPAQARDELARLSAIDQQRYSQYGKWNARMEPLLSEVTGRSSQIVWLLAIAGGFVLLVACANIAGLSVARAVSRRKELTLREALGANRWQLLRVGLAENLVVSATGACLGLLLARAGLPLLQQLLPEGFPRAHEVVLTFPAAVFAVAIAMATGLIAGLLPARSGRAIETRQRVTAGRDARRLRRVLVAAEVALAGLLCAGSLFLLRSYQQIAARDHGFRAEGVLTFSLNVPNNPGAKRGDLARLYQRIGSNIAAIPGVASVGASTNLPWSGYDENTSFGIVGATPEAADGPSARTQAASAGYFQAAGMRLLAGRFFETGRDVMGQPLTAIVNDALAARYFPRGNALGATLDLWGQKRQIIGIVSGITDFPADLDTKPGFWFPLEQVEFGSVFYAIRSTILDPASLTAAVAAAVHSTDSELALADIRTLDTRAAAALASRRFALWLFQAFAALALLLAATGIYALLAYFVQQRRKELGIRAALGATRANLWNMVLSDGLRMAAAGAGVCLLLIPLTGSLLQTFLFQVKAFDFVTAAAAPAILIAIAVFASLGPARSATRSDPAAALREE